MDGPISKFLLFHAQFGYETETKPWKNIFSNCKKKKLKDPNPKTQNNTNRY
jgi:hypothetical protein